MLKAASKRGRYGELTPYRTTREAGLGYPPKTDLLQLWLRADSLALNDGDAVSTWTDESGNGNNATGSGSTRPLYKTNIVNGRPVVRGDGVDDYLTLSSNITISKNTTWFCVAKNISGGSYRVLIATDKFGLYSNSDLGNWIAFVNANINSGQTLSSFKLVEAICRSATDVDVRTNGANLVNGNGSSFPARGGTRLFADPSGVQFANADIAEILVYKKELYDTDLALVRSYLNSKYALY
jgi:hypothetical protein